MQNILELEMAERDMHNARLRYAEAKQRALMSDGDAPTADEALLHKLEQDLKNARERLRLAREHARR